jgi:membrane-anchored mycosin MYCP
MRVLLRSGRRPAFALAGVVALGTAVSLASARPALAEPAPTVPATAPAVAGPPSTAGSSAPGSGGTITAATRSATNAAGTGSSARTARRPVPKKKATAPACTTGAAGPGQLIRDVPWQQTWLDPERVWPFATGAGQVVAVIDSGADGTHPQLRGRVLPGYDVLRSTPDDNADCLSHGTAVASLIAAQQVPDVGLRGLAPDAQILPIRVTDVDPSTDQDGPRQPTPSMVATAIRWATAHHATVIDVSPSFRIDDPGLREAVDAAQAAGIVVVAAVGDRHNPTYLRDDVTYPAGYDGVIGVGAVDRTFIRAATSDVGPHVLVCAPGDEVVAATRITGHQAWSGSSIAAASVAATVALVRQAWPGLRPNEVADRIVATADPAPGGQQGPQYGHGIVDPYRAVTEQVSGQQPVRIDGLPAPKADPAAQAHVGWWRSTSHLALITAGSGVVALAVVVAVALVAPQGRHRQWRPQRAAVTRQAPDPEADLLPDDDGDLFALPERAAG